MKNMFGDDVQPRVITFEWNFPHLTLFINGHFAGMVSPNGWQGYSMDIHHKLGEPLMRNFNLWYSIGFTEMQNIMREYNSHMEPARAMHHVIDRIATDKKLSFDEAKAYLKEKNIPLYFEKV